jgi:hypothetical protein
VNTFKIIKIDDDMQVIKVKIKRIPGGGGRGSRPERTKNDSKTKLDKEKEKFVVYFLRSLGLA